MESSRLNATKNKEECSMCYWDDRFCNDAQIKECKLKALRAVLVDNYGKCDNAELARQIKETFSRDSSL
jgi:hypothetical protein